jgi:hypothetical protein
MFSLSLFCTKSRANLVKLPPAARQVPPHLSSAKELAAALASSQQFWAPRPGHKNEDFISRIFA